MLELVVWTLLGFMAGSLPFSVWLGRVALRKDITAYGDANPGATNVLRAGGKGWGALALALDIAKALLPVAYAWYVANIHDWRAIPIALAPIAGHAFSPFLRGRGGKAIATSAGTWMALTVWQGPTVGGLLLWFFSSLVGANGWAVLFMFLGLLPILLLLPPAWHPFGPPPAPLVIVGVWLGNVLIVLYKHRRDLAVPPRLAARQRKQAP